MSRFKQKYGLLIVGVCIGIAYGVITRIFFGYKSTLASVTYLFIIPVILGIIPLLFADEAKLKSYRNIIFIPWITILAFFLVLLMVRLEEFICLIILALPFFVLGTIGALLYSIFKDNKKKKKNGKLLTLVVLPFILSPVEDFIKSPSATYTIESEIIIAASPETIWNNIIEVQTIEPEEYTSGFFNAIGIPRPVNASVNRKESGGQRIGNFEGGLRFIETITEYKEFQKVSFNIRIDSSSVRQRVFDQHVLNGNYFTFVNATYQLSKLDNGKTSLRLSSGYQLTSKINFYGKFWGDLILSDFQDRLLEVIKNRCEKGRQNDEINQLKHSFK